MTIQDIHNNFDIEVDKTSDFEYPYMLPEQKDYWLNKAQDEFILDILEPKDPNKKSFEETQERIEDIRTIVKETPEPIMTTQVGTRFKSILPEDYLYRVRHTCKTKKGNITYNVGGEPTKQYYVNNMLKDPFWSPIPEEPIYYIVGDTIVYETLGGFDVLSTELTYIKRPNKMQLGSQYIEPSEDVDCELPEWSQRKILDKAVAMVLENFESQRYQTNLNELKNN